MNRVHLLLRVAAFSIVLSVGSSSAWADTWFGPAIATPVPFDAVGLEIGFLDTDGMLDVVLGRYQPNEFHVYLGDGSGHFTTHAARPRYPSRFGIGNIDGSGCDDLIFPEGPNIWVYYNDGTGSFQATPTAIADGFDASTAELSDLDGDGYEDAIVGGDSDIAIYWGSATGLQVPPLVYNLTIDPCSDVRFKEIAVAEFTGDTNLDFLASAGTGNEGCGHWVRGVKLFEGLGGRQFYYDEWAWIGYAESPDNPADYYDDLAVGDIDGDGDSDFMADHLSGSSYFRNDGAGNFTQPGPDLGNPGGEWLELADFDSDGMADLAWTFRFRTSIHAGNESMSFPQVQVTAQGTGFVQTANIDGITGLDLVGVGTGPVINVLPNLLVPASGVVEAPRAVRALRVSPTVGGSRFRVEVTGEWLSGHRRNSPLVVHDILGRLVRVLPIEDARDGTRILWDATDAAGRPVPPGLYWLRDGVDGSAAGVRVVVIR